MNPLLGTFNSDFHTKEALIEFIHEFIDKEALRRVYKSEDIKGIPDARALIDGAFEAIKEIYEPRTKQQEAVNQAR